ncbi:MAG: pyridine nucleotide-disulfide oxidoreductase, partial [Betaproteobacteria bacterium]|nr:pyridine nucleotide-disulfide oxidoreductase [Betaproteobacteria bacterium]
MLNLAHGLSFNDLYHRDGLLALDAAFLQALAAADATLHQQLTAARANPDALAAKQESELLIVLAPHVDDFVAGLFGIVKEVRSLSARHNELAPIFSCKRLFVQRKALHKYKADAAAAFDGSTLKNQLAAKFGEAFSELAFAQHVTRWLEAEEANAEAIDFAQRYAAWAVQTPDGKHASAGGVLFKAPHKLDVQNLVPLDTDEARGFKIFRGKPEHLRHREGFKLTDRGTDLVGALDQAHYCIWCHEQGKDSCSKGLKEKGASGKGVASFKKSPFGVTLAGCPLEEKISEFHKVKTEGHVIGALAVIIVDNPMLAATGHRIC